MVVLPGITIRDKIYESANSLVYRGVQDDGRSIVAKILKQDYPSLQELTRYRQEYQITRSLNLEGVIKAYRQQDYQRTLVILLEDFGGESLEQWMRSQPDTFCPMPVSTFLHLAIELTDILGRIHAAQVIHKDINPGNIVLNLDTGVLKIIDFGIATQFSHTNPMFKSPHVLEGTLAYLSPEQTGRINRSIDYRTDFYSLGVTFYELLTGHLPFPETNMLELVYCHIAKQPVPPHEMNAAIPKPISDIILKLMAKNAEDRYQSAWGIKADLELCDRIIGFQNNSEISSQGHNLLEKTLPERRSNRLFEIVDHFNHGIEQLLEAEEFYEQAIQGARDNEYLQEEALAYELAAKFYLARGRVKFAQTYMNEAHYCYERWGATAKVKDLETRYPQFFPQSSCIASTSISTTSGTTSRRSDIAFDLEAVMNASQAISSEIELDRLLSSLMKILIENAGAQTGFLILENLGEWAIEAACEFNDGRNVCATRVLQSMPIANRLPESIIQYVIRTHEPAILNNATREGNFINDPYIQHHQTQSILCIPMLNQGKLIGILYIENQLAAGAFTQERSKVLHLLSTQAAIAIENAKLYAKLRASESKMAQFLEAVPVAIVVGDITDRLYYFNQRATQLLGKGIDPAVTSKQISEVYQLYLEGTDRKYPTEQLPGIRALSGERTRIDDVEIHQNDTTIPVEVLGTPVFDEQGTVAYAIATFQDITERKQTEYLLANYNRTLEQQVAERTAALQASEIKLRALFVAIPDPLFVLTTEGRVIEAVDVGTDQLYKPIEAQVGKTLHEIFSQAQADEFLGYIHQVLNTQQMLTVEYSLLMAGQKIWFSARIAPIRPGQVIWLARDISDRKRAEEASILEERNRMAREIHDTLAQSFTGILVQIGAAMQVLADDTDATQAHLEIIDELARIGLAEARRSVTALRPQLLEEGDLHSALHRLVTQMRATADTALIYEITGTAYGLSAEVENNLFRIGQEALTNAIKYANASEIQVKLAYEATQCSLHIKDDGIGFGVGSIPPIEGFGLLGISERAERIGAQLTIHSQPGHGTEIIVIINKM